MIRGGMLLEDRTSPPGSEISWKREATRASTIYLDEIRPMSWQLLGTAALG
jgi:hypothetical protein